MAFKRYPTRYVRTYRYVDPETKEPEDIAFIASGELFPLFKSLTDVELGDALTEYKKSCLEILTPESAKFIAEFDNAADVETKFATVQSNPEQMLSMLRMAQKAATVEGVGFSLIELLLMVTHICALPEADRGEALAVGLEILPAEVYQDPAFAFEILGLAVQYDDNAKKNSTLRRGANTPR